jgi:hypothetical protein
MHAGPLFEVIAATLLLGDVTLDEARIAGNVDAEAATSGSKVRSRTDDAKPFVRSTKTVRTDRCKHAWPLYMTCGVRPGYCCHCFKGIVSIFCSYPSTVVYCPSRISLYCLASKKGVGADHVCRACLPRLSAVLVCRACLSVLSDMLVCRACLPCLCTCPLANTMLHVRLLELACRLWT